MTLALITAASSVSLVVDAMNGDTAAKGVLAAANRLLQQIDQCSRADAMTCWLCDDNALWRDEAPGAIGVLMPYGAEPMRVAVAMALCPDCTAVHSGRELGYAAVTKLRTGWMPGLRTFVPVAAAGHA